MTERVVDQSWDNQWDAQVRALVERIVTRTTRLIEQALRDTDRVERRVGRAAAKARRHAERAGRRAARLNEKIQRRTSRGKAPRMKDELRSLSLEIERQALAAVESALREVEQQLVGLDVEAITRRVEEHLASIDVDGISQQAEQALKEASMQIQKALERRGYVARDNVRPAPEPVSDEERLVVLRMVQSGTITAEEAETLLDALEGTAGP